MTDHKPNTYLDSKPLCNCQAGKSDGRSFCLASILQESTARVCIMLLTLSVAILHAILHAARCSHEMHALQAKDSESDSEADMNIYDSLNVSAHFLQCVRNGYAADPWFANEADTKT